MMKLSSNYLPNVLLITQNSLLSNQFHILVTRTLQLKKYINSISIGIVSRHGESSLNMTSTILKKLKTGMKKDGWSNKTEEEEKVMKRTSVKDL